jgi:alanine dehydrogenase
MLRTEDVQGLVSMEEHIEALDIAFKEFDQGQSQVLPRERIYQPLNDKGLYYWHNNIVGTLAAYDICAVRVNSAQMQLATAPPTAGGKSGGFGFHGDRTSLVFLYQMSTAKLVSIVEDGALQLLRVGATTALGVRCMARQNSSLVGIFGSGPQARMQLQGICNERQIERVKGIEYRSERRR